MNENEYFKCPACLNRSAHMIRLSDETDSDGTYENYTRLMYTSSWWIQRKKRVLKKTMSIRQRKLLNSK